MSPPIEQVGRLGDDTLDAPVHHRRLDRDGRAMAIITDDVERVTGQKPASFESWCWRNAAAFE